MSEEYTEKFKLNLNFRHQSSEKVFFIEKQFNFNYFPPSL